MKARKNAPRLATPRHYGGGRIKDEVYRQMFRLEEHRPGAEMGLALALLRAWLAADRIPQATKNEIGLRRYLQSVWK